MPGTIEVKEVKLVSPDGLQSKILTINNSGAVLVDGKGIENSLLKEYIVTGSAVTSIDFTGLDINTHKSYRVEVESINATATHSRLLMYVNGDTTTTNYYHNLVYASAASVAAQRINDPTFCYMDASTITNSTGKLALTSGYPHWTSISSDYAGSSTRILMVGGSKTATVTNITQLTFTCTTASGIGIGTKIRIYRGDL